MADDSKAFRESWFREFADYFGMLAALGALICFFSFKSEHFLTFTNLRTVANQIPAPLILAVGMTFVLLIGGIDLSVGSVLALASGVLGWSMVVREWPLAVALLLCLGAGLACGVINGYLTVNWRLPSFIVTLAMLEMARGGAYLITDSQTQYIGASISGLAEIKFHGFSITILLALIVVAAAQFVLSMTIFGRYVKAIGFREEAARYAGINTRRIRFSVYALCGLLTGLAAIFHTSRLASADPNSGVGMELEAIAAVVIGGTRLTGGYGSVIRSLLGVMIIAVLNSGLAQMNTPEHAKRLITGGVIVGAVLIDQIKRRDL